ncbi:MAPEG family protein [Sandaracinobacteroides saxicola]|uniref:MAPEG family protein n=1 Tax=Sandaracinobacteroides saxicola TaxID=2759707 RepID=A0A7G5IK40_9SPHN|nr:MAPEG family protein [Sandaracinobacteroides saxicola]QMW23732.1 MAPEG family protein [Sandaracinobacteroides saxicola]
MPITLITAGAFGLLLIILSVRVTLVRRADGISLGDGGNAELLARARAQANFTEYVPFALILMGLLENAGADVRFLAGLAMLLFVIRILHAIGMARPAPNTSRVIGTAGTWTILAILSGAAIFAAVA